MESEEEDEEEIFPRRTRLRTINEKTNDFEDEEEESEENEKNDILSD